MKKKDFQKQQAQKSIDYYFSLLDNSQYSYLYVREILRLSEGFRIRLSREEKLRFCKKCLTPFNVETRKIRFSKGHKEFICLSCSNRKKIPY